MMTSVTASVPPLLAQAALQLSAETSAAAARATERMTRADALLGTRAEVLSRFMSRAESLASSKIEGISATLEELARAAAGTRTSQRALSMIRAGDALRHLIRESGESGILTLEGVLEAHHILMREDEHLGDRACAGQLRTVQNWIGGSDYSPRSALYVPPPPDLVPALMDDLFEFMAREDLPPLVQAAAAHAQFESIHPFTDGNGRIGRALISALLQKRGVTLNAVLPLASGLNAVRDCYFASLTSSREGQYDDLVLLLCDVSVAVSAEALTSAERLAALPGEWAECLTSRSDSAARKILPELSRSPIVTADEATALAGSSSAAYTALTALEEAGILREITGRKRDRVWTAAGIFDEITDLDRRIQERMKSPREEDLA